MGKSSLSTILYESLSIPINSKATADEDSMLKQLR